MSVIVKGMKMPKSCADCFATSDSLGWCKATDNEVFNPFPKDGFPSFCPLRPLPEKHGRLVDVDAIISEPGIGTQIAGWGKMYHETVLQYAPTIVEAEGE